MREDGAPAQVFEELLEDRNFRVEILEGNEKIEHILSRTNTALKQWDDDIDAGLACSAAFTKWLRQQDSAAWKKDRPEVMDIFDAMNGNAEGWQNAFDEMNTRAQEMNNLIIKLMTIVAEMEKKAGEISRKTWVSTTSSVIWNHCELTFVSGPDSALHHSI